MPGGGEQRELGFPRTRWQARMIPQLRRITTRGNYIPEIDGLRFIAIMAVVAVHIGGYWMVRAGRTYPAMSPLDADLYSVLQLGGYGVHLFFIISGFVLAMPFCKHAFAGGKPVNLGRYFWRRVTRLEPPYVVSMLGFFLLMPFFGKGSWAELWPHLLASLTYTHNLVYGEGSLINNAAWSLEVEIQFYLLMPLIASLLWLQKPIRQLVFGAAILLFSLYSLWVPDHWPKSILQYAQYFLMGILLCDLWTRVWQSTRRRYRDDLPGLMSWPLFMAVNLREPGVVSDLLNPWIMSALFFSALCGRVHGRILSLPLLTIVGGMCYSIYLLHGRVLATLIHGGLAKLVSFGSFTADYVATAAICLPAVIAVSTVFFVLVERPCMSPDWPTRLAAWIRRRRP
jgi:peptidoglycan/LPS O-acetylase OafA/YrhL